MDVTEFEVDFEGLKHFEVAEPNPANCSNFDINASKKPYLEILVQPEEYFRFRYSSEGGSHGCLEGRSSTKEHKTYPTVKLHNYEGEAIIKCQLYQWDKNKEHPHILQVDRLEDGSPSFRVPYNNSYVVSFKHRWIMHIGNKNVFDEIRNRLQRRLSPEEFQRLDKKKLRKECKEIELYIVRLRFSAHEVTSDQEICEPVYSDPIFDSNNPDTRDLKIIRSSRSSGTPRGGQEILMFIERIPTGSKKIQVNFFEKCPETDEEKWRVEIPIMSYNVHRQLGIYFDTPPYKEIELKSEVKVFIELQRLKDLRRSKPVEFTYLPKRCNCTPAPLHKSAVAVQTTSILTPPQTDESQDMYDLINMLTESSSQHDTVGAANEYSINFVSSDHLLAGSNIQLPTLEQMDTMINNIPNAPEDMYRFCETFDMSEYGPIFGMEDYGNPFQFRNLHSDSGNRQPVQERETNYFSETQMEGDYVEPQGGFPRLEKSEINRSEALKLLIQEISTLKKEKLQQWYSEVTMRLEVLFGIQRLNGDTILHTLLTLHLPSFKYIVAVASSLHHYHLLNAGNEEQQTILHLAIINEMPDLVTFLIEKGCNPGMRDVHGYTAVHQAVKYPSTLKPLLDAIIKKEDDANVKLILSSVHEDLNTPLHLAIELRRLECVQLLLDAGSNPLSSLHDGLSTIQLAVLSDNLDILRELLAYIPKSELERAVNLPLPSCYPERNANMSPLQIVCAAPIRDHTVEIIRMLLEKQACPYQTCGHHEPAWQLAKRHPAMWAVMKHFVKNEHRGQEATDDEDNSDDEDNADDEDISEDESSDCEEFLSADEGELGKDISKKLEAMRLTSCK